MVAVTTVLWPAASVTVAGSGLTATVAALLTITESANDSSLDELQVVDVLAITVKL